MRWALTLSCGLLLGCGGGASVAPEPPPAERAEVRPPKPSPDHFWMQGHWVWRESDGVYYWAEGGWERERSGFLWLPGHWRPLDRDGKRLWEWVPEKWVRTEEE